MKINELHPWNLAPSDAIALQKDLRKKISLKNEFGEIKFVAGCDMALDLLTNNGYAGIIVYSWPDLKPVEKKSAIAPLTFPYVPGLLSFREIPVLARAFEQLEHEPDLFFFDGQGIAHPRSMGIATHMGLLLDKPTIGCAKSKLYGEYEEPGPNPGDRSTLLDDRDKIIGMVLRTKHNCRPLFISPGHKIDLETSVEFVVKCLNGFRVPKPTREADIFVAHRKREHFLREVAHL